jgi:hypothetical protein
LQGVANVLSDAIVMESDILWRNEFNHPENDYREYREMWLRLCENISQAGKPAVLCGSALPSQFENCKERRYFSQMHYLAITCNDELLRENILEVRYERTGKNCCGDF